MIHHGIEYGLMQAYAEGFALLKRKGEFKLDLYQIAGIWRYGSVVCSWLLDLITGILAEDQALEASPPMWPTCGINSAAIRSGGRDREVLWS